MLKKTTLATVLLGSTLLATAAFAQTPPASTDKSPSATTSTSSTATTTATGDWRASKMAGLKVYNDANENIGSINDLLMDKSGAVKIAVIGVGGFLGMGEHLVAVPFEKLKFATEAVAYTGTGGGAGSTKSTTTTGAAPDKSSTSTTPSTSSSSSKWYPDHAVFDASKDDLKNMPEFKYSE